ncbi:hypothetical protein D3C72_2396740 [compost metagenome]
MLAVIEPIPRILILETAPACPDDAVTCTPATLPFNALSKEVIGVLLMVSCLTTDAAPVYVLLLAVP